MKVKKLRIVDTSTRETLMEFETPDFENETNGVVDTYTFSLAQAKDKEIGDLLGIKVSANRDKNYVNVNSVYKLNENNDTTYILYTIQNAHVGLEIV